MRRWEEEKGKDDKVRREKGRRGEEEQSSSWQVSGVTENHLSIEYIYTHTHTHTQTKLNLPYNYMP